jgi:hypothetical protein
LSKKTSKKVLKLPTEAIVKGRLGGRKFQYNPPQFSDNLNMKIQDIASPGISYPVVEVLGAETETIKFDLYLNGRGLFQGDDKGADYVEDWIKFLQGYMPPQKQTKIQFFKQKTIEYAFGPYVKTCRLKSMPIDRTGFTRDARTLEATIHISLVALW